MEINPDLFFSEIEKTNLRSFYQIFLKMKDQFNIDITNKIKTFESFKPLLKSVDSNKFVIIFDEMQEKAIIKNEWNNFFSYLLKQGEFYARADISLKDCFDLTNEVQNSFFRNLDLSIFKNNLDLLNTIKGLNKFVDILLLKIAEGYVKEKQSIIKNQQKVIQELSHPILQIRENLLVLPLIGILDSTRAKQMTKDLLYAVRDRQAKVCILDVTGLPIVDTKVANHLIQTTKAINLMGATIILTGISPEIAQTMVTLGAELTGIETLLNLESGILRANKILGLKIVFDKSV
jgi:anti-anti-sigma regulatory factor